VGGGVKETAAVEYVSLSSQFIVPIIEDGSINGMIVLSIGLEVLEGSLQSVQMSEPKIRSAFLQSLFNHANNGGFAGNFTEFSTMDSLRRELIHVSRVITGANVSDVLILDITRR
jgi:flagellar FliL protein